MWEKLGQGLRMLGLFIGIKHEMAMRGEVAGGGSTEDKQGDNDYDEGDKEDSCRLTSILLDRLYEPSQGVIHETIQESIYRRRRPHHLHR